MFRRFKDFILAVREGDEARRRRWVIFLTIPTMALIVGIWVLYLHFTDTSPLHPAQGTSTAQAEAVPGYSSNTVTVFKAGLHVARERAQGLASSAGAFLNGLFHATNEITLTGSGFSVTPRPSTFVPADVPKLLPHHLP